MEAFEKRRKTQERRAKIQDKPTNAAQAPNIIKQKHANTAKAQEWTI